MRFWRRLTPEREAFHPPADRPPVKLTVSQRVAVQQARTPLKRDRDGGPLAVLDAAFGTRVGESADYRADPYPYAYDLAVDTIRDLLTVIEGLRVQT